MNSNLFHGEVYNIMTLWQMILDVVMTQRILATMMT